jgi:hypothetical protein
LGRNYFHVIIIAANLNHHIKKRTKQMNFLSLVEANEHRMSVARNNYKLEDAIHSRELLSEIYRILYSKNYEGDKVKISKYTAELITKSRKKYITNDFWKNVIVDYDGQLVLLEDEFNIFFSYYNDIDKRIIQKLIEKSFMKRDFNRINLKNMISHNKSLGLDDFKFIFEAIRDICRINMTKIEIAYNGILHDLARHTPSPDYDFEQRMNCHVTGGLGDCFVRNLNASEEIIIHCLSNSGTQKKVVEWISVEPHWYGNHKIQKAMCLVYDDYTTRWLRDELKKAMINAYLKSESVSPELEEWRSRTQRNNGMNQ